MCLAEERRAERATGASETPRRMSVMPDNLHVPRGKGTRQPVFTKGKRERIVSSLVCLFPYRIMLSLTDPACEMLLITLACDSVGVTKESEKRATCVVQEWLLVRSWQFSCCSSCAKSHISTPGPYPLLCRPGRQSSRAEFRKPNKTLTVCVCMCMRVLWLAGFRTSGFSLICRCFFF
jgi:hypothetical protein